MALDKLSGNSFATGAIANSLGYTPANKAGDTFSGAVTFSGPYGIYHSGYGSLTQKFETANYDAIRFQNANGSLDYARVGYDVTSGGGSSGILRLEALRTGSYIALVANNTTSLAAYANGVTVPVPITAPRSADGIALNVTGSYAGNPSIVQLGQTSSDGYIKVLSALGDNTYIQAWNGGTSYFSGNLAIGTTTSATKLTVNGNTTITGKVLNNSGNPILNQTGSVLQVLNTYFGTPQGIGSGSWIDTGLSLTITPSSTSSKILIIANVNGLQTYSSGTGVGFQLVKNGTSLIQFGIYFGYPVSMYIPGGQIMYLDSPATTSAITYKVQHQRQLGTGSGVVNGDNSNSFFTLMEIAG